MASEDVPVLIAGGSLVGLSTALFLGSHTGPPSLVVERHPGTAIHPRAAAFQPAHVELYRARRTPGGGRLATRPSASSSRTGRSCRSSRSAGRSSSTTSATINDGVEGLSPSPRLFITQIGLEPIIRTRAEELGARLEYSTELVDLEIGDDGVTATLRRREDGGAERTVRGLPRRSGRQPQPGPRPPGRRARCGHGSPRTASRSTSAPTSAPLIGDRNLSVIYVFGPRLQGFFRFSKAGDAGFLVVNKAVDEER